MEDNGICAVFISHPMPVPACIHTYNEWTQMVQLEVEIEVPELVDSEEWELYADDQHRLRYVHDHISGGTLIHALLFGTFDAEVDDDEEID